MSHLSMEELSASLDRALTGADLERSLAHLSMCSRCRERQTRLALHDDALRRLLADDPDDRVMDELARRSEAIATAIVRGLAVPPIATSTPLDDARDVPRRGPQPPARVPVERLARFEPPAAAAPPTIQQDPTATPAGAGAPLPPPRDPSRLLRRPDELDPSAALGVTPRLDTERAAAAKPERVPENIAEGYDAFNDRAYAGPTARQLPPMLGRPTEKTEKKEGDADPQSPKPREYRHGGVRREPVPTERARESADRRGERPAANDDGFGVKRKAEPAWSRLGLQPDPTTPGSFRDSLTGASITPPPADSRRPAAGRSPSASKPRSVIMAPVLTVGGVLAVVIAVLLALRIPTGARLSVQFGRPKAVATTPAQGGGTVDVRGATTPTPVDVAVPSPSGGAGSIATGGTGTTVPATTSLCGQVVDAAGRPLAGVVLTVVGSTLPARTDANGHFCLVAPAGARPVDVVDPRVVPGQGQNPGTATRRIQLDFVAGAPETRVVLP